MAKRRRHPNKHIDEAVQAAIDAGWELELGGSHAWGHLYCLAGERGGCIFRIWSTPRSPEDHAKDLRRALRRCPHSEQ